MSQDDLPALQELKKAVAGLTYPSESDEPLDVFCWPASAGAADSAQEQVVVRFGNGRKIAEVAVERFFAALRGADKAERFRRLRQVMESQLTGLRIFRVGDSEVEVDIYLLGTAPGGEWVGVHTMSVET